MDNNRATVAAVIECKKYTQWFVYQLLCIQSHTTQLVQFSGRIRLYSRAVMGTTPLRNRIQFK